VVYYRFELRVLCFAFLKIYPETRNPKHETKNFCVYLRPNYHLDRIGSPIMITDESGNVVKEKKYEAFGNLIWAEGTHDDNREFTGKEKEPTGFHYFGARRYYGNIGRFLSPDPHTMSPGGFELTDPQTLNPYVFCTNDPLYYFDPDGLYRITNDNIVYRVTFGRGTAETAGSMVPMGSVLLTLRRRLPGALTTAPDDIPNPSAEIVTGEDWFWAWASFTGVPVTPFWGAVTFLGTMVTISEGDIDKICMGMFAHAHPEAKVEGYEGYNRLDLNKVYKDQKNGADIAKEELEKMKKFVKEVHRGTPPERLIRKNGGEYPNDFLKHYGAVSDYKPIGDPVLFDATMQDCPF
jgi:RHS repeat-associated protein